MIKSIYFLFFIILINLSIINFIFNSIIFNYKNIHPIIITLFISLTSIICCLLTSILSNWSLIPFIIFLIILGGIIVLFCYFARFINDIKTSNNFNQIKLLPAKLIILLIIFINIKYLNKYNYIYFINKIDIKQINFINIYNKENIILFLYSNNIFSTIIFIIFLFFCLNFIAKIILNKKKSIII